MSNPQLSIDTNISISYMGVGGRILKSPVKFQLPDVHAPHNPLPSSAGGACEYDGIVFTLLNYCYDGQQTRHDWKSERSMPATLKDRNPLCGEKAYGDDRGCSC